LNTRTGGPQKEKLGGARDASRVTKKKEIRRG